MSEGNGSNGTQVFIRTDGVQATARHDSYVTTLQTQGLRRRWNMQIDLPGRDHVQAHAALTRKLQGDGIAQVALVKKPTAKPGLTEDVSQ
jgi:hypothetical protein